MAWPDSPRADESARIITHDARKYGENPHKKRVEHRGKRKFSLHINYLA
jgi:hypothetical protein